MLKFYAEWWHFLAESEWWLGWPVLTSRGRTQTWWSSSYSTNVYLHANILHPDLPGVLRHSIKIWTYPRIHGWENVSMITQNMWGFQPLLHGRLLELLGASTQLAICSKWPCNAVLLFLADHTCRMLFLAHLHFNSPPPLQLSRKVVRTRSEHSSQSAHTLHYVRTHPATIAERNVISLYGDSRPHRVQTEKAEIPSWKNYSYLVDMMTSLTQCTL
jgi:hypothetical protein